MIYCHILMRRLKGGMIVIHHPILVGEVIDNCEMWIGFCENALI